MGIIKDLVSVKKGYHDYDWSLGQQPHNQGAGLLGTYGTDKTAMLQTFYTVKHIGNLVALIAYDIANSTFSIKDDAGQPLRDYRIDEFMRKPYPGLTFKQVVAFSVMNYLLTGDTFLCTSRDQMLQSKNRYEQDFPVMFPLSPAMTYVYDNMGRGLTSSSTYASTGIGFYRSTIDMVMKEIDTQDIIHMKLPSPMNPWMGMGIPQRNLRHVNERYLNTLLNEMFYKNGGFTNLIIERNLDVSDGFNDDLLKMIDKKTEMNYTKVGNAWRPLFLPSGTTGKVVNMSMRDNQHVEMERLAREDAAAMLELPGIISNIDAKQRFDTAEEQLNRYNTKVLQKHSAPLLDAFNQFLKERFNPKANLHLESTYKLPRQEAMDMADRGAITVDELRQNFGLSVLNISGITDVYRIVNRYMNVEDLSKDAPVDGE